MQNYSKPRKTRELEELCNKPRNKKIGFQGEDRAQEENGGNFQENSERIFKDDNLVRSQSKLDQKDIGAWRAGYGEKIKNLMD